MKFKKLEKNIDPDSPFYEKNHSRYHFYLIEKDQDIYFGWARPHSGLISGTYFEKQYAQIKPRDGVKKNPNLFDEVSEINDFWMYPKRGTCFVEMSDSKENGIKGSSDIIKDQKLIDSLDEIINPVKITAQNVADALRLLMKIERDKNKVFPRPKGEEARQAWKKEAYKLLNVKEYDNPIEKIRDVFKSFSKEGADKITDCLKSHYAKSNYKNKRIVKPRIAQAQALFLTIKNDIQSAPDLTAFKKAKTVSDLISADSKYESQHENQVETFRGSITEPDKHELEVHARSSSYRDAADNEGVHFAPEIEVRRVSRHSEYTRPSDEQRANYLHNKEHWSEYKREAKKLTSPEALRLNREEIAHVSEV